MKNTTKTLAVITVLAVALAGFALTASTSQNPAASTALRKQPLVDEIIPQDACLAFNWGISNKVIRPKLNFASHIPTSNTALPKQPMVDEIIPPDAYLVFNWGISNKVIRPKRIFASQSQTFAPTAG